MAEVKEGLPITPSVVRWARERAGYSMDDAVRQSRYYAIDPRMGIGEHQKASQNQADPKGRDGCFERPCKRHPKRVQVIVDLISFDVQKREN